ncbi:MAG: hypothetical protein U5K54_10215 [Cytophagales bacterium]|nr:hypothetical protein [Cytophagales bacterium]
MDDIFDKLDDLRIQQPFNEVGCRRYVSVSYLLRMPDKDRSEQILKEAGLASTSYLLVENGTFRQAMAKN